MEQLAADQRDLKGERLASRQEPAQQPHRLCRAVQRLTSPGQCGHRVLHRPLVPRQLQHVSAPEVRVVVVLQAGQRVLLGAAGRARLVGGAASEELGGGAGLGLLSRRAGWREVAIAFAARAGALEALRSMFVAFDAPNSGAGLVFGGRRELAGTALQV